jgi:error-prone DNA polymerase
MHPPLNAFGSFFDFVAKVGPAEDELSALILAGAFDSLHPNRRALLWAVPQARDHAGAVHSTLESGALPLDIPVPQLREDIEDFTLEEKAVYERALLGLDVGRHLMAFERERIQSKSGVTTSEARRLPIGAKALVVGNPIRLRFPPTASGKRVVFFDLEDETGLLNVTCFDDVYRRDGHAIVCSQYVTLVGITQDRDGHTAFLAERVFPYKPHILHHVEQPLPLPTADYLVG